SQWRTPGATRHSRAAPGDAGTLQRGRGVAVRMSSPLSSVDAPSKRKPARQTVQDLDKAREAITYFRTLEEREEDHAPLSWKLIRRISTYTRPYRASRNWLFVLTLVRGIQLPLLAWMIGRTINGPIAGHDLK